MKTVALVAVLLAALNPSPVMADRLIPFQARLTNASGLPVADGVYKITFRIYQVPLGGTAEITEEMETVSVIGGYVNVLLGAIDSLDGLNFANPYYLGITVDLTGTGGVEMVPRHQLVPAFHARTAERATLADRALEAKIADRVQDEGVTIDALDDNLKGGLVPPKTVAFFDRESCPSGWSKLAEAEGRVIVGLPPEIGTLKGINAAPRFADRENRKHGHALASDSITGETSPVSHNHTWAKFVRNGHNNSDWKSWNSAGTSEVVINHTKDGTHTNGAGQANLRKRANDNSATFYTTRNTHTHTPGTLKLNNAAISEVSNLVPTIQLLVCRKN